MIVSTATALASDYRLELYMHCWSEVATKEVPLDNGTEAYVDALTAAAERANTTCNALARFAAETNGRDTVNEMWRYMEVQFFNANLRERD